MNLQSGSLKEPSPSRTAVPQKCSCLELEICVHLLQIPTPKDLQWHILLHSYRFQGTWVARGYHSCLLLTPMVHACRSTLYIIHFQSLVENTGIKKKNKLKKKKKPRSSSVKAKFNLYKEGIISTGQQERNQCDLFCCNKSQFQKK